MGGLLPHYILGYTWKIPKSIRQLGAKLYFERCGKNVDMGRYVSSQNDYVNSINHFTKKVYYQLAEEIVSQMENATIAGKSKIFSEEAIAAIKRFGKKILKRV